MRSTDVVLVGAMALSVLVALASEGGDPRRSMLARPPRADAAGATDRIAAAADDLAPTPTVPRIAEGGGNERAAGPGNFTTLPPSGGAAPVALDHQVKPRAARPPAGAGSTRKAAVAADDGTLIPGGTGACVAGTSAAYEPSGRFLYVTQIAGRVGVCAYRVEADARTLAPIAGSPFAVPAGSKAEALTIDPSGRFLFVADGANDTVSAFTIDGETGALALVPGSPFAAGRFVAWVAVDPSGRFLYAANNGLGAPLGSISAWAIDRATGALAPLPGAPYPADAPNAIAIDPKGRFLYVAANAQLQAYAIDAASGALAATGPAIAGYASGVTVDPTGRFVYATGGDAVASYAIGENGALTSIGAKVPTGSTPRGPAVSRSGRYLYVANLLANSISGYRIDAGTGALTPLPGSPFPALERVFGIATGGAMPRSDFADVGYPYSHRLAAHGGLPPYSWSIESGALPPGLALAGDTGMVSGIPATAGTYDFTLRISDAAGPGETADFVLTVSPHGEAPGSGNWQGLWWRAPAGSESGWGINFAQQGDIVFATWFTYGADGKPLWFAAVLQRGAPGVYSGDLFTTTGPPFDAQPWDRATVVETTVGTMTVRFSGDDDATLDYTVNGVAQSKPITRQRFGALPACTWGGAPELARAANVQDLWWKDPAGSEAGWGVNLAHQGDIVVATWFTYDANGKPWWLIAVADRKSAGVYEGPIYTVTGPPFDAVPWDPAQVTETLAGSLTIAFADGNRASFAYTVNGVTQAKEITRQVFAPPGTVCIP